MTVFICFLREEEENKLCVAEYKQAQPAMHDLQK